MKDRLELDCRDWGKVIFANEAPIRFCATSGKKIVQRKKVNTTFCHVVMPTVNNPEDVHE